MKTFTIKDRVTTPDNNRIGIILSISGSVALVQFEDNQKSKKFSLATLNKVTT